MKIEISVPSKTFLFGEYLVLNGGPALFLNSTPRFKLIIEQKDSREVECLNFGQNPAAERFIQTNPYLFDYLTLNFIDPYKGLGGFGASSALYLLVAIFKRYLVSSALNPFDILSEHNKFSMEKLDHQSSGSEIISQLYGGITFYHKNVFIMKRIEWPFQSLSFCLVHTDQKINTTQNFQELPQIDYPKLEYYVFKALNALLKRDADAFCKAMNRFAHQMQKSGLTSVNTNQLLEKISQNQLVLAAKGCGVLGDDVVCVLTKRSNQAEFIEWLKQQNLFLIGADNLSYDGISIRHLNDDKTNEKVILVDVNDKQIGVEDKLIAHKKALLHRAFSIFIFRKKEKSLEILLQQRADNKYHSGGLWSNACCSHPVAGEDMALWANTRLKHEMGFNCPLTEVAVFRYVANVGNGLKEHEVDHIFIGEYNDEAINPNPDEVQDYRWISLHDLIVDLKINPKKYTPWLGMALRKLLAKKVFYKK